MLGMWALTMGIIVVQRDLGAALLLFGIFLAMRKGSDPEPHGNRQPRVRTWRKANELAVVFIVTGDARPAGVVMVVLSPRHR